MQKISALLLVIWVFHANGASFRVMDTYFLLIDCGVKAKFTAMHNNQSWFPDSMFIDSGKIKNITSGIDDDVPDQFTTLRYFPKEDLINCYDLALTNEEKFIFRAGFHYGNYDGKSQPPVFDLLLGGQLWATVNSSASNKPIIHELIYTPKNGNVSVCLRAKKDGGVPFISSLESTNLRHDSRNQTVYTKMKNGTAYHLISRVNFGGYDKVVAPWSPGFEEEYLNRYWIPQQTPGYVNLSFHDTIFNGEYYENRPPGLVINTAIAPQINASSQSIHLPIAFPTTDPQTAYVVLYFYQYLNATETRNATRYMDIYVDGVVRENVKFDEYRSGEVVTLYPLLVQDVVNLTISPANGTVLPPLINGMEVFIATELDEQPSYGYRVSSSMTLLWILHFLLTLIVLV